MRISSCAGGGGARVSPPGNDKAICFLSNTGPENDMVMCFLCIAGTENDKLYVVSGILVLKMTSFIFT